jgi:alpha-tubulin suppressor-like RCC1 family protein
MCWGRNTHGELGNDTTDESDVPTDVSGLTSGVASVSAGGLETCAVTTSGGAKCWGTDGDGELGNNSTTESDVPVDVSGLTAGVASISAGNHTCAVTTTGGVKCWGLNLHGELGNNSTVGSLVPVDVSGLTSGVSTVSNAGTGSFSCALTSSGGAKCWGSNGNGELGNNSTTDSEVPVDVIVV